MEKNISITVPMEHGALTRAAEMFSNLALDLMVKPATEFKEPDSTYDEITENAIEEIAASMGVPKGTLTAENASEESQATAAEVFAQPTVTPTPENVIDHLANMETAPAPSTLDKNGIPWDNRIHASTKTKTVDGAWKNKRGVDKELLASVELELKNVMDIATPEPAFNPIDEVNAPAPVVEVAPTPTPAAPSAITTFPELMTAITARGLEPAVVSGAVQAVGLQSLPLLAARTDLIPQVAQRLGL